MIAIQTDSLKELNRKIKNIGHQIIIKSDKPVKEIYNILFESGNNMINYIKTEMRNSAKAPWSYKKTKDGKRHHPSMPGNFPRVDTGEGWRSVAANVKSKWGGLSLEFGVNTGAPYLKFLEGGKEKYPDMHAEARPWLEPTVNKFEKDIIKNLGDIFPENITRSFEDGMK